MNSQPKGARGFSMVEVLVSLTVLGVGLLALAKFQTTALFGADRAKQITEAVKFGQDKIEELRAFSAISGGTADYLAITSDNDTWTGTNAAFTRTWTVTDSAGNNYKTLSMVVSWTDQNNEAQTVTLSSTISRSDPVVGGSFMLADSAPHFTPPPP